MLEPITSREQAEQVAERRITAHLAMGGKTLVHRGGLAVWRGSFVGRITGERCARLFCLTMRVDFVVPLASLVNVDLPGVA